jgi:hypothetical protein
MKNYTKGVVDYQHPENPFRLVARSEKDELARDDSISDESGLSSGD